MTLIGRWRRKNTLVVLPEARGSQHVPSIDPSEQTSSQTNRIFKLALSWALALILAAVLFASHPWTSAAHAVSSLGTRAQRVDVPAPPRFLQKAAQVGTDSKVIDIAQVAQFPESSPPTSKNTDRVRTVSVQPGKTLLGICIEHFGSCGARRFGQIRKLNPKLDNINHIETGQSIRIPAVANLFQASVTAGDSAAAVPERNTQ